MVGQHGRATLVSGAAPAGMQFMTSSSMVDQVTAVPATPSISVTFAVIVDSDVLFSIIFSFR